jgi:hypothetical protein
MMVSMGAVLASQYLPVGWVGSADAQWTRAEVMVTAGILSAASLLAAEFPNMGQPKFDGTTTTGNDYKVCFDASS